MIVLDASYSIFGTADPISFDEYKARTGVDLNDIFNGSNTLSECSKLVLGLFESSGNKKVLTPIHLSSNDSGGILVNSSYDNGVGDFIVSRLIISYADKTVAWGEI